MHGWRSQETELNSTNPESSAGPSLAAEQELDRLIGAVADRKQTVTEALTEAKTDPLEAFRRKMLRELIPAFAEMSEKYAPKGFKLDLDASSLLQGGRGVNFDFALGDYRLRLEGTATHDRIAFQEIRYAPDVDGELMSGPLVLLSRFDSAYLRSFVCDRLMKLLRAAMRSR